ncbi:MULTISPECIES: hypothetical protein [unclassified Streptomyces]
MSSEPNPEQAAADALAQQRVEAARQAARDAETARLAREAIEAARRG